MSKIKFQNEELYALVHQFKDKLCDELTEYRKLREIHRNFLVSLNGKPLSTGKIVKEANEKLMAWNNKYRSLEDTFLVINMLNGLIANHQEEYNKILEVARNDPGSIVVSDGKAEEIARQIYRGEFTQDQNVQS